MGKRYLQQWLSPTSIAAIRLAFGEEAEQVIKLTNAYLKTIKSTDPARALQISGFINEDPLLYLSPRVLISHACDKDLLYVLNNSKEIDIAVYGGTSADVSRMEVTIDGVLAYNKLQSETAYGSTNGGGVDIEGVINTARMNASSDWWRVSSRGYVAYDGVCYTDWQQILDIKRLATRQEFKLIGITTPA
jgi:hypothetical protein